MSNIKYKGNKLFVENIAIKNIVKKIKTPFYLYSRKRIEENFKSFSKSFKNINPLVCFSVKANSNKNILRLLGTLGSGADVVSGGELIKVLKSGIKPSKVVFSGVGKSYEELTLAIKNRILLINVESENEIKLIDKISKKLKRTTSIGVRLNPNIDAKTLKKISTGKADDKFGISEKNLESICKKIHKFRNIKLDALSVHIGSQILSDNPYKKTLAVLGKTIKNLKIKLKYIDLGGGFGISYQKGDKKINLSNYSNQVNKFRKKFKCKIIFEPGRAIVGDTGILVSKIQYLKENKNKIFAIIDAGMNDFIRPALYGAVHEIAPILKNRKKNNKAVEFVGPICESSCKFIKYKKYQKLEEGEFIAILNVGAYGSTLSSNYNTKPLIAEIITDRNNFKIIRKRQNLLDIV